MFCCCNILRGTYPQHIHTHTHTHTHTYIYIYIYKSICSFFYMTTGIEYWIRILIVNLIIIIYIYTIFAWHLLCQPLVPPKVLLFPAINNRGRPSTPRPSPSFNHRISSLQKENQNMISSSNCYGQRHALLVGFLGVWTKHENMLIFF